MDYRADTKIRVMDSSSPIDIEAAPVSKTYQYKKITKPLLERKRRARINACLDELKDIMTVCLQSEGENVSKLEKADILELTVRHLHKLSQAQRLVLNRSPLEDLAKFRHGYSSCAHEAAQFLVSTPGVDIRVGQRLLHHLMGPTQQQQPHHHIQSLVQQRLMTAPRQVPHPMTTPPKSVQHPMTTPPRLVEPSRSVSPKTVPLKPEPIRPTMKIDSSSVWKPYSS